MNEKFILNVYPQGITAKGKVVRIDAEAASMLSILVSQTGIDIKTLVSDMIKFCYPITEIKVREIDLKETENER